MDSRAYSMNALFICSLCIRQKRERETKNIKRLRAAD